MMNLTTDPWIPAIRADGTHDHFSLGALFAEAHRLRDLAVRPHERIALMRLLICITQAALDGPDDEDDWADCQPRIQPAVAAYLARWKAAFELFGDGQRFLQLKPGIIGDPTPCMEIESITRLNLALSSGESAPTLFDNEAAGPERVIESADIALSLLTYQCYSPLLGRGYKGRAPCADASALHAFLWGQNLLETLHANLLSHETVKDCYGPNNIGRPVWENWAAIGSVAQKILTDSYLGRLVPVSRSIWIDTNRTLTLANGIVYEGFDKTGFREPTITLIQTSKTTVGPLRCNEKRAVWRQFHSLYVAKKGEGQTGELGGPLALRLSRIGRHLGLWTGGMIFPKDQAKIRDSIESTYSLRPELFDPLKRSAYEKGVSYADTREQSLRTAIKEYGQALRVNDPSSAAAIFHFWTRVEQNLTDLFAVASDLTPPDDLPGSDWGKAVRAAAIDAYERSCPRGTPRQLQAFALGLRYLHRSPAKTKSQKTKSHA